jgi:hypothetical protein
MVVLFLNCLRQKKRDFPRFDQSLLVGTAFENWQPELSESDFDNAAKVRAA